MCSWRVAPACRPLTPRLAGAAREEDPAQLSPAQQTHARQPLLPLVRVVLRVGEEGAEGSWAGAGVPRDAASYAAAMTA